MTEEDKNLFYKMKYTGVGRVLTFILIVMISGAIGFGILYSQTNRNEEEIVEGYIKNELEQDILEKLGLDNSYLYDNNFYFDYYIKNTNTLSYNLKKSYESGEELAFNNSENEITQAKDYLIYLKGEYDKEEGLKFTDEKIPDGKVLKLIKESMENTLKTDVLTEEIVEEINSEDEDYLEKMRKVESFDDMRIGEGFRYTKEDYKKIYKYGELEYLINTTEVGTNNKEEYVVLDEETGDVYPKGNVLIYNNEIYPLKNAEFVYVATREDIVNNPFISRPIEKIYLLGILPGMILATILVFIFNIASKYKNMQEVIYIRSFDKIYADIGVAAIGLMAFLGIFLFSEIISVRFVEIASQFETLDLIWIYILLIVVPIIILIGFLMLLSYGILILKGLINNGIIETIKNKTLIAWIIKKISMFCKFIKEKILQSIGDVGTWGIIGSIIVTAILSLVVILFSALIPMFGGYEIWTIAGLIAIVLTYKGVYTLAKSIKNINNKSNEIAKGNYDEKIENSLPYFKNISNNFNKIGDNLSKAVEEQVKAERMRTELITNVSHDLKTPLTSIINYSKILIDDNVTEEEKIEYSQVVYEKAEKLKILIEDLFQISKATSNNIEFQKEKLDFSAMIIQAMGEWRDNFEDKNLNIVLDKPNYPIVLNLDGNKTYRVLDNLMNNICKYSQPNTRVYVDLIDESDIISLTLKNISSSELNIKATELIERFVRGDKSRNTEGSGLGLAIASSLVEGQGGEFHLEIDGDLFKVKIVFSK